MVNSQSAGLNMTQCWRLHIRKSSKSRYQITGAPTQANSPHVTCAVHLITKSHVKFTWNSRGLHMKFMWIFSFLLPVLHVYNFRVLHILSTYDMLNLLCLLYLYCRLRIINHVSYNNGDWTILWFLWNTVTVLISS